MTGCRISSFTLKSNGIKVPVIPATKHSFVDNHILDALDISREYKATGCAIVLTFNDAPPWSIGVFKDHPATLVGGLHWLSKRLIEDE